MTAPPRVSFGIADTSVFIAAEGGRRLDTDALPDEIAVSVITVGELRAGVLAAADVNARQARLNTLITVLAMEPVPVDEAVAEAWAGLRVALRDAGRRMPVNDSWIAASAIALGVPVFSQDADYDDVPGLTVVRV